MTTAGYALGLTWKYPTKGQCTMPDSTAPTYTAKDVHAAYTQGRRDAAKDSEAYTQGWADGHNSAVSDTTPASIAQHLSMDVLETAWEQAEEGSHAHPGDEIIVQMAGGGFYVFPAAHAGPVGVSARILQRAPRPQLEVPTDSGVRFIAHSSAWSDDAEDQAEFITAGPFVVSLADGSLCRRDQFERFWTVTGLVSGDD